MPSSPERALFLSLQLPFGNKHLLILLLLLLLTLLLGIKGLDPWRYPSSSGSKMRPMNHKSHLSSVTNFVFVFELCSCVKRETAQWERSVECVWEGCDNWSNIVRVCSGFYSVESYSRVYSTGSLKRRATGSILPLGDKRTSDSALRSVHWRPYAALALSIS